MSMERKDSCILNYFIFGTEFEHTTIKNYPSNGAFIDTYMFKFLHANIGVQNMEIQERKHDSILKKR